MKFKALVLVPILLFVLVVSGAYFESIVSYQKTLMAAIVTDDHNVPEVGELLSKVIYVEKGTLVIRRAGISYRPSKGMVTAIGIYRIEHGNQEDMYMIKTAIQSGAYEGVVIVPIEDGKWKYVEFRAAYGESMTILKVEYLEKSELPFGIGNLDDVSKIESIHIYKLVNGWSMCLKTGTTIPEAKKITKQLAGYVND